MSRRRRAAFRCSRSSSSPSPAPTKGIVYAEIVVAQKARLLLAEYEAGEEREGVVGKHAAIPDPSTAHEGSTFAGAVCPELRFRDLRLKPFTVRSITRSDTIQYKGKNRTFELGSTTTNRASGVTSAAAPSQTTSASSTRSAPR